MPEAGWYADPGGSPRRRWWDGQGWTQHLEPVAEPQPAAANPSTGSPYAGSPYAGSPYAGSPYAGSPYAGSPYAGGPYGQANWGQLPPEPWKGAKYGRPREGPGALATPGRRLGARLLDGLVLLPVTLVLMGVAVVIVAPHAGPMFPPERPDGTTPTPGILWVYLAVVVAGMVGAAFSLAYETIATARYGRTLGKAWLHIRPVREDGSPLTLGRSFGRAAFYVLLSTVVGAIGLLDQLWCLWDQNRQCLHDKVVGSIVVND